MSERMAELGEDSQSGNVHIPPDKTLSGIDVTLSRLTIGDFIPFAETYNRDHIRDCSWKIS
jgi:hypothetical protein